jgi:hypothetical protein
MAVPMIKIFQAVRTGVDRSMYGSIARKEHPSWFWVSVAMWVAIGLAPLIGLVMAR